MKHTHSYHDCTKWFKLDFTFKESTFVLGTENPTQFLWLGNLYFSEFPRSAFHLQNTMLTNYILFFLPGYKIIVPWEKKSRHGTDRKTDIQIKLKHGSDLSVFAHVIIFWKATCFPHLCKTVFVMKEACQHENWASASLLWEKKLILNSLHAYMQNWTSNIFIFLDIPPLPAKNSHRNTHNGLDCWSSHKMLHWRIFCH